MLPLVQPVAHPAPLHATLDEWIARETIPFASPAAFHQAVGRMLATLGDSVQLLGFGEALHGEDNILALRNRLFERLVEAHGFSAIALESSFPKAHAVNEYISGHGPTPYETGFSHGFGRLEANRELVKWMRRYNADASHPVKLRFYGFDSTTEMSGCDSPHQVLRFVLEYFASIDGAAAGKPRRDRIESLLGDHRVWENSEAMADPMKSVGLSPAAIVLRIEIEDLVTELKTRRPELVAQGGEDRHAEAMQYASAARWLLNYHAELARESGERLVGLLSIRDAWMADNLAYAVSCERGRGKVFAFSHNSHLQRGKAQWQMGPTLCAWWPAGAHLTQMLGAGYAAIGSAVGISETHGIGPPEPGTLESLLTAAPGPARFIPTHQGQGLPPAEIAALRSRPGSRRNPTYFALTPQSLTDFDWLAVV